MRLLLVDDRRVWSIEESHKIFLKLDFVLLNIYVYDFKILKTLKFIHAKNRNVLILEFLN